MALGERHMYYQMKISFKVLNFLRNLKNHYASIQ